MFLHIFLFRWKAQATLADHLRATREIAAFDGAVPGLTKVTVGPNLASNADGYTFGGCLEFTDAASCTAYLGHPLHVALLDWLVPLIDAVELDLQGRT